MRKPFNMWEVVFFLALFFWLFSSSVSPFSSPVDFEERTAGGFYEPIQVVDIEKRGRFLTPIFNSPSHGYSYAQIKKFGPVELIFQRSTPEIKIRTYSKSIIVSPRTHIGPLHILWQRLWMELLSPSIYSARLSAVMLAIILLIVFYSLILYLTGNQRYAVLSVLFLTFHPRMSGLFQKGYSVYILFTYISFLSLIFIILKKKKSLTLIALFSGIMLHSHILVGGALLTSVFLSYILTYGIPKFSFKDGIKFSAIVLFIAFLPLAFYIVSPATAQRVFYPHRFSINLHLSLFVLMLKNIFTLLFLSPFYKIEEVFFRKDIVHIIWQIVNILPGIILLSGLAGAIVKRKNKEVKFLLLVALFFSLFGIIRLTRPHHYLPLILIFLLQYIIAFPERKNLKSTLLAIPVSVISIVTLIGTLLSLFIPLVDSPYEMKTHKEIGNYLLKNHIYHPYSLIGPFGYELLTYGKVRVVDFTPLLAGYPEKLKDVLLLAEDRYMLVRDTITPKRKRKIYATLKEIKDIAKNFAFHVKVIKRFPYGKKGAFCLVKIGKRNIF